MIALLSTNFFRIRRDLLFWLALCVCLVGGIAFGMGFRGALAFDDFYAFPFFVALCAFLSLFLGREYGDGTLRNKVTAGYRRGQGHQRRAQQDHPHQGRAQHLRP